MIQKISANKIHTVTGETLENHVILLDSYGRIEAIEPLVNHDANSVDLLDGEIIPGFINAHCHLELSHMKGLVPTGTGLLPFLQSVVKFRDFPEEEILDAIREADAYMYDQGIMAVGDISNKTDTFATKAFSKMRYYTFVEFFNLMQSSWTENTWNQYHDVYKKAPHEHGHKRSCVPHAPYSVSPDLFTKLQTAGLSDGTVSIHNQETHAENDFFLSGTGAFIDFYKAFGLPLDGFTHTKKRSIHYALPYMDPTQKTLFVHNTTCIADDLIAATDWSPLTYWVTCPNANLYIENKLPYYQLFMDQGVKICLGTDSLTSNWQLSIFEEMKTIQKYQSYVPFEEILKWATLHGAEALGYENELGSIEVGKKPGLLLIQRDEKGMLTSNSGPLRVI